MQEQQLANDYSFLAKGFLINALALSCANAMGGLDGVADGGKQTLPKWDPNTVPDNFLFIPTQCPTDPQAPGAMGEYGVKFRDETFCLTLPTNANGFKNYQVQVN